MAYSINLTKRANGGFTIVLDGTNTYYPSDLIYHGTSVGVTLFSKGLSTSLYKPTEWTIQSVGGYTTVLQVVNALDALGVTPADALEDVEALLTTIDADTGNIATNTGATKTSVDSVKTSVDLVKTSTDTVKTSTDTVKTSVDGVKTTADLIKTAVDSIKTAVEALDNMMDGNYGNVNMNVAGSDVATNAGTVGSTVPRITLASDDPAVARLKEIAGQDFLCITDALKHDDLDCTMIYVMADAVFASIEVDGVEIIDSSDVKGMDGVTFIVGTMLPFGKEHATSITLTSGSVIAYIN